MRRRDFIWALVVATVPSFPALTQRRVPVIAILLSGPPESRFSKAQMDLLHAGMASQALVEGKDYVFEIRAADGDSSRFPALAAELLSLHPAACVASTNLAITSIQGLSRTVPIVGASLNSPVAVGLVASLSHPGGNVTGVSTMADELVFKSIEIMREILPQARNVTVVLNPTNSSNPVMLETLTRQLDGSDLVIRPVKVTSSADLDTAFDEVSRQHPDALVILTDNSLLGLGDSLVTRATAQRVPVFAGMGYAFSQAGALINYSRDQVEAFQATARLLKKILEGANPADLPVEQPTKFVLSINLKTAKALNISIPSAILARADEVIE